MVIHNEREWAMLTFGACVLGDQRRTNRLVAYAAIEASRGKHSTSAACAGDAAAAEGAYRLMRNEHVDPGAIAEGGFQATVAACADIETILALEDSTTLGFKHAVADELGDLGGKANAKQRGFWVHSVLLVNATTGGSIGLVHQDRWIREGERKGSGKWRGPDAAKESEKWELASTLVAERLGPAMSKVISVCDREADMFEYVAYKVDQGQRFVVRSCNDRQTKGGDTLWGAVTSSPRLGRIEIEVAQRGGPQSRPKRSAQLTLRARQIEVMAPRYLGEEGGGPRKLWAVHAVEEHPTDNVEALEWLLLTSEAAPDLESAARVLRYYARRWRIEDFHKAWKSGCGVEERRMQTAGNLERVAVVLSFVAVRAMQLNEAFEANPEDSCESILEPESWRCLWASNEKTSLPKTPPDIAWARGAIARLGGWLNTKRTGRVGWSTMMAGWLRLNDRLDGFRAAMALHTSKM